EQQLFTTQEHSARLQLRHGVGQHLRWVRFSKQLTISALRVRPGHPESCRLRSESISSSEADLGKEPSPETDRRSKFLVREWRREVDLARRQFESSPSEISAI